MAGQPVPDRRNSDQRRFVFELLEPRRLLSGTALFFTKDIAGGNDQLLSVEGLVRGSGVVDLSSQPGYLAVETGDTGLNVGVIATKNIAGQHVVVVGGDFVSTYAGDNINTQLGSTWNPNEEGMVTSGDDSVVVITDGGRVRRLDSGLVVGASRDLAGTSLTRLAVGGTQIAIGDSVGVGRILDTRLNVVGTVDVNGSNNYPITAVAAGSVGDVPVATYFADGVFDGAGNIITGTGLLYDSSDPDMISNPSRLLGTKNAQHGAVPGIIVDAAIGDTDPDRTGNEIVVASFNPVTNYAPGGTLGEISTTASALVDLGKYHGVNNHIAGIAVGPHGNAEKDSIIQFGASPWGGDTRPAVDHWQAFDDGFGAESPPINLNWLSWHGGANRAEIRDGVIGEISTAGDGTSADFVQVGPLYATPLSSNESNTTLSSNSIIEIQNTNSGSGNLQEITVAGEILTSVALADIVGDDGLKEIVVGAQSGNVLVYTHTNLAGAFTLAGSVDLGSPVIELATLTGGVPIETSATGVDAVAIGDFGSRTNQIVVARETSQDSNDVLILSTGVLDPGVDVEVAGDPTSGGTAHGLVLGDFQDGTAGNEALTGFTDETVSGGNGHQLFYTQSGSSGQHFLPSPVSDVALGDLNGSGEIDYVLTGLNNSSSIGFGQGSLILEADGGFGTWLDSPGLSGPHNPPSFLAVAIGNLDSDSDQELALAGDDFVRVLDNDGQGVFLATPLMESNSLGSGARFVDVVIADADGDAVNEVVAITDFGEVYMFGRSTAGNLNSAFSSAPIGVYSAGGAALLGVAALPQDSDSSISSEHPDIAGREVFYNNSSFDGDNPLANSSDDLAIATDKTPLLSAQTATFTNYTSFSKGINGIFVDFADLADPQNLGLADFEFRVGSGNALLGWDAAPQPVNDIAADIRLGEGTAGSDRVTLIWNDNAIANQWLEVRVKATANTGLSFDDLFYVGNVIGETGNSPVDTAVTTTDLQGTVDNPHGPFDRATITDLYDFNRDQLVGATDAVLARNNRTSATGELELFTADLNTGNAFRIVETDGQWMQLQESTGGKWNFEHFSDPAMAIESALKIGVEDSPLDLYLDDEPGGMRMYLWKDGELVPNMPHTNIKPTMAVWGDMLVGDIITIEDNPMTMFMRQESSLSASATTSFFAAAGGTGTDVDGGAAMILHPDHHRDLSAWPEDPVQHPLSGSLELIAYGQGNGAQSNAILFKTRSGPGTLADRMMIKDGTVSVYGNVSAAGSITAGSSQAYKENVGPLAAVEAAELIAGLEAIHFSYKAEPDQPRLGFVAEEVAEVFGTAERKGVDAMGIVAALSRLVRTNDARIDQLTEWVEALSAPGVTAVVTSQPTINSHDAPRVDPGENCTSIGSDLGTATDTVVSTADSTEFVIASTPAATDSAVRSDGSTPMAGNDSLGLATSSNIVVATSSGVELTELAPLLIPETDGQWFQLETAEGQRWNFDHVNMPQINVDSGLRINIDNSPLDLYLDDESDGLHMYLWEDGRAIPNMPHTNEKPAAAIWGDIFVENIATIGRQPIQMFLRDEVNLSASSGTVFFSANKGINHWIDGGAGIVMHPDHHQDLQVWPSDPVTHSQSGVLQLMAYGIGSGAKATSIIFQTRDGPNSLADRMVVNNGVVIYGNLVATGSITPGSSREYKTDIEQLSEAEAVDLVAGLEAVSFTYTAEPGQPRLGFIAEEIANVFGTAQRNGVDSLGIAAALTKVVQTQQHEIDNLQAEMGRLPDGGGLLQAADQEASSTVATEHDWMVAATAGAEADGGSVAHDGATCLAASQSVVAVSSTVKETTVQVAEESEVASDSSEPPDLPDLQGGTVVATSSNVTLQELPPFKIVESAGPWLELEETGGKIWAFEHFSDPSMDIDSALHLHADGSARDLYLADEPDGMRMYLWEDGVPVPDLPQTGAKPHLAIGGDFLLGDIITGGRGALSMFNRVEGDLSASATTTFFSAREGISSDVDGGAGIVLHPDHHQDLQVWPGDPVDHQLSGSLELIAYGQGSGQSNAIILQTGGGSSYLGDRMVIKDGSVTVYGNVSATGSVTPGSSRETKNNIETLSDTEALELITGLVPVSFTYTAEPGQPRLGFIAEDVAKVFGTVDRKGVDPMGITAALSRVVQTQHEQLEELFAEMSSLGVVQGTYAGGNQGVTLAQTAATSSLLKTDRVFWPASVTAGSNQATMATQVKQADAADPLDTQATAIDPLARQRLLLLAAHQRGPDAAASLMAPESFHPENYQAGQERRLTNDELTSVWSAVDDWLWAAHRRAFR